MYNTCNTDFLLTARHDQIINKMLSYRREIEMQGALVTAESGRLGLRDNTLRILEVYLQPL